MVIAGLKTRSRAQALLELALVMPILVGIIAVLFQFGILFIAFLAMVHETRDVGRWLAVHPDNIDSAVQTHVSAGLSSSVFGPSAITVGAAPADYRVYFGATGGSTAGQLYVALSPTCSVKSTGVPNLGKCVDIDDSSHRNLIRPPGQTQQLSLVYDPRSLIFLPTDFRLGPWLRVKIPLDPLRYDYYVMVEPA